MSNLIKRRKNFFSLFDDDFFDEFFNLDAFRFDRPFGFLRTNIIEENDKYVLEVEAPGLEKGDFKITYEDGYLTIEVEKKSNNEHKDVNYLRRERFYGACKRRFYLDNVDSEGISASYKDGILRINVPKEEEEVTKVKTITVE